jgi:hypothetical protein
MTSITVVRKTTNTYNITFTDSDGDAVDITNWTVFFTVKKSVDETDAQATISKTITTHSDPTQGKTTITLTSSDTDKIQGEYLYDIAYIDDSGSRKATEPDTFIILGTVTQRSA